MADDRPRLPGGPIERTDADAARSPMTHVFEAIEDERAGSGTHPLVRPPFEPPRRPIVTWVRRTGWLTVLVAGATLAVLAVASSATRVDAGAHTLRTAGELSERVALPAVTATIGLDTDSREAVLNLCWRVSDNANVECRLSWLEERGELPPREVPVAAFEMDRREVSNSGYQACVDAGACDAPDWDSCRVYTQRGLQLAAEVPATVRRPEHPAVCVDVARAEAFCAWRGGRLPTAVEWERAARGGETRLQPWGRFWSPALANWGERDMGGFPIAGRLDGHELTAPVDAMSDGRSPEGIEQLLGNVAEWVAATEEERAEGRSGVRGGSYADEVDLLRATRHSALRAEEARTTVGFRCAYDTAR